MCRRPHSSQPEKDHQGVGTDSDEGVGEGAEGGDVGGDEEEGDDNPC